MDLDLLSNQSQLREQLSSGALCDALDSAGLWSVLPHTIRAVSEARTKFFGPAYTVSWGPMRKQSDIRAPMASTWQEVRDFLIPPHRDVRGMVYIAGSQCGCIDRYALAGGMSTRHFQRLGMEAVVLFGAIRDAEEIALRKIPIFATGFSPLDSQGNYRISSAGSYCNVGDIRVNTGDWVFGDTTGVVVLPAHLAPGIVSRALEILRAEAAVQEQLDAGANLPEILDRGGHI